MKAGDFQIYPNPVQDNLTLEIAIHQSLQADLSIISVLGQQLNTIPISLQAGKNKISVSTVNLTAGVYILNIRTDAGSLQKKFVKE